MERSLKETIRLTIAEELKENHLDPTKERVKWMYANMMFKTNDPEMLEALIELLEEK